MEYRCEECHTKIAHVSQKVEQAEREIVLLQQRVTHEIEEIHQQREERDAEYIRNMARGEDTFKALFGEMHKLREQLVEIVTTALKDRNVIEQQISEKNIALAKEMRSHYVSKESARLTWFVFITTATLVVTGLVWLTSALAERDARSISEESTQAIIQAIQAQKGKP